MSETTGHSPLPEIADARKALYCLNLELEPSIVRDVTKAVESAFTALLSTQDALRNALQQKVEQWRANADMLGEGNKNEHYDPSADMQRALADELSALLHALLPSQTNEPTR